MTCIENKRNYPHIIDIPESKRIKKSDCVSNQHFINYVSVPSLANIATLKIATGLLKQSDIIDEVQRRNASDCAAAARFKLFGLNENIFKLNRADVSELISELKENAYEKLSLLPLPNLLKEEVAIIIEPLLIQIFDWMYSEYPKCLDWDEIPSVYWTTEGTIDKAKTLRQLIHSDSILDIHICHIFKLACKYCLEDSIFYLWEESLKSAHREDLKDMMEKVKTYDDHFTIYWISILEKKFSEINSKIQFSDYEGIYNGNNSVYKNMFTLATKSGNTEAVKHFFNKFTAEEKSFNLVQWIKDVVFHLEKYLIQSNESTSLNKYSDVLYFLLSQMDDAEQQREVFLQNSAVILRSLFEHWSMQKFLLPTLRTIWSSLDQEVYAEFLFKVGCCLAVNKTKLLRKLWLESPKHLKKYFIKCSTDHSLSKNYSNLICNFLEIEDVETIKLILSDADIDEKEKIIFSLSETDTVFNMMYHDKLFLFDTLISETLSPVYDDIQKFKENIIKKHGNRLFFIWTAEGNWQMVEKYFKWTFSSQDQIDEFKNQLLKTSDMKHIIMICLSKYELEGTFMQWCVINADKMKKKADDVIENIVLVLELGLFEEFIDWYSVSGGEITDNRIIAFFDFFKRKSDLI